MFSSSILSWVSIWVGPGSSSLSSTRVVSSLPWSRGWFHLLLSGLVCGFFDCGRHGVMTKFRPWSKSMILQSALLLPAQAALKAQIPVLWLGANMSPTVRKSCFPANSAVAQGSKHMGLHAPPTFVWGRWSPAHSPNPGALTAFCSPLSSHLILVLVFSLSTSVCMIWKKADCRPDCSWYLKVANNGLLLGCGIVVPTIWSEVHSRRDTFHLQSIFPLNLVDKLFTKDNSTRNKFNLSFVDILIFEFRLRWPRGAPVSHPCNGTTSTPPRLLTLPPNHSTSNGTLRWHPAMGPRPLHPAVAPKCHVQSAKVVRGPPALLEERTPIAIAIWGMEKKCKSYYIGTV